MIPQPETHANLAKQPDLYRHRPPRQTGAGGAGAAADLGQHALGERAEPDVHVSLERDVCLCAGELIYAFCCSSPGCFLAGFITVAVFRPSLFVKSSLPVRIGGKNIRVSRSCPQSLGGEGRGRENVVMVAIFGILSAC